ncbi:MAG: stage III sporulation protein AF [Firmicutes bacterium]|nr:stage III sporulation protein AF [Bacillota bacterium]
MEVIRDLVREIAIIVLLASFLEMLLPNSNMKSFVKVVMGLFVIVTVLGPVGSLLKRPVAFEVNAWRYHEQDFGQSWQTIMTRAESFRRETQTTAVREYEKRLAQQVEAVARLVRGIDQVEARVNVCCDQKTGRYGAIEHIVLLVSAGARENQLAKNQPGRGLVEPVEIQVSQGAGGQPEPPKQPPAFAVQGALKTQLQQTVANFYGLKLEQIEVIFK